MKPAGSEVASSPPRVGGRLGMSSYESSDSIGDYSRILLPRLKFCPSEKVSSAPQGVMHKARLAA